LNVLFNPAFFLRKTFREQSINVCDLVEMVLVEAKKYTIAGVCRLVLPLSQALIKRASWHAAGK